MPITDGTPLKQVHYDRYRDESGAHLPADPSLEGLICIARLVTNRWNTRNFAGDFRVQIQEVIWPRRRPVSALVGLNPGFITVTLVPASLDGRPEINQADSQGMDTNGILYTKLSLGLGYMAAESGYFMQTPTDETDLALQALLNTPRDRPVGDRPLVCA
jgi:hypothetical protein